MFNQLDTIEVLSRAPLWYIDEEGKIGYIQNTYSDAEIIRVTKDNHSSNYPINKCLTIIPELNTILFETQEDAIIGISMLEDQENQNLMIENSVQKNMHSECYSVKCSGIESGLYSYSNFDKLNKNNINIMEIRYLDSNEKIKLIHGSDENSNLNNVVEEYIRFMDIKSNHHDPNSERFILDIISESGNVYIKSFWVNDNGIDIGPVPFMISPLSGYLMFTSKPNAAIYRNDVREGLVTPFNAMVGNGQLQSYNGCIRNQIKEQKKQAVINIVSGAKDIVLSFISTDQIVGFLTDKTGPNIIRAYKRFASKHRSRRRKAAFMKKQKRS